ncbi:MAG: GntR family transcriptional regulator, partial [Acidimicrobiia bacterium]|nr:GntR family transcriptional regulator [Acidimicrobiia bacterium]
MTDENPNLAETLARESRPTARQTAHEFVRETLRTAILSGSLVGGTRLVQADIADMLRVSTTPVREALRDLASEGMIRLDAHRGGVVHELSNEELAEIYDIRSIMEPAAMRQAVAKMTDEILEQVTRIHEKMAAAPASADFVDDNRDFHLAIYDAAGSPRMASILKGLLDASVMYVSAGHQQRPELRFKAVADHAQILEALYARDEDGRPKR